jgi:hypothetical protein
MEDWLIFALVGLIALGVGALWAQGSLPEPLRMLLLAGIGLRLVGATARLEVIEQVYSGVGDAKTYFDYGVMYADQLRSFDFAFLTGEGTIQNRWWGTQFIRSVTAIVVLLTGESYRAAFLVFALLAFTGLVLCVRAFGAALGKEKEVTFARWVWLWPSLWFWPSSIGKEALMLFAVGLTFWGYAGSKSSLKWVWLGAGLLVAGAIRPHIAGVLACCVVAAESIRPGSLGLRRFGGLVAAVAVALLTVSMGLEQLGLDDADMEGVQEQFEFRSDQTVRGGSRIEVNRGPAAIPMAFVTILMRPFPWEAQGVALLSSAEMTLFWLLVINRGRTVASFVGAWRRSSFMRLAVPTVFAVSLMYGLAFANLGIIARQRAIILPFLLSLLTATPVVQQLSQGRRLNQLRSPG